MANNYRLTVNDKRTFRYYYSKLGEVEKKIYRSIYDAVSQIAPFVEMRGLSGYSVEDLTSIFDNVKEDNPRLFWVLPQIHYNIFDDNIRITFDYAFTREEIIQLQKRIEYSIKSFVDKIPNNLSSEYEVELFVHDLLSSRITYKGGTNAHTIIGPLLYKEGVCQGISYAFKLIMDVIGIKCIVQRGQLNSNLNGNHAWNIVTIDGEPYHIDVTNDRSDYKGFVSHRYFNNPDSEIINTHSWKSDVKCRSFANNYYFRNGTQFNNVDEASKYIQKMPKGVYEIKVMGCFDHNYLANYLMKNGAGNIKGVSSNPNSNVYVIEKGETVKKVVMRRPIR